MFSEHVENPNVVIIARLCAPKGFNVVGFSPGVGIAFAIAMTGFETAQRLFRRKPSAAPTYRRRI